MPKERAKNPIPPAPTRANKMYKLLPSSLGVIPPNESDLLNLCKK